MPFLPDERSTDKLSKHLAIELMAQFSVRELRDLGFFQFRDYDRPQTLVATEFAAEAFIYTLRGER